MSMTFLRGQLAAVGIFLDEPPKPASKQERTRSPEPEPDRSEIRTVLQELGAPERDLEWLVASCPSVADALTYKPPVRSAWCHTCNGVTVYDDYGCVPCRGLGFFAPLASEQP